MISTAYTLSTFCVFSSHILAGTIHNILFDGSKFAKINLPSQTTVDWLHDDLKS